MGGKNDLSENTFTGQRGGFKELIKEHASQIYAYMNEEYFSNSDGTLILITYQGSVAKFKDSYTKFVGNTFADNKSVQNEIIPASGKYWGSLIIFDSDIGRVTFIFRENLVSENQFIGTQTSLIYLTGGIFEIGENEIKNNGYVSEQVMTNNPASVSLSEF